MSRNNITFESNKRLFESRLQMKTNSNSINKISLEKKSNNNINASFLNNTQPYTRVIFNKNRKNQSTLENSFFNNINNNFSINKKIIKIRKNRNRNKKISLNVNASHDKSSILIKDITFYHLKNSFNENDRRNKTILNINKKMTQQNSINKSMGRKNKNHKLDSISLNSKKIRKNNEDTNSLSSTKKKMNLNIENKNNSNNNNKLIFKDKYISKFKLKSRQVKKRNGSSLKKNSHHQNSLLIHKIKKIRLNKKPDLNSAIMTNNNSILGQNLNQKGRNKNGLDISIGKLGHTQRNLFADKNIKKLYKNTFGETKYKNNKLSNNNSTLKQVNHTINYDNNKIKANKNKKAFNNSNINSSNISNKFLLKNKEKKMGRNYKNNINKKFTFNKFNKKGESLEFKALNISKRNNANKKLKVLDKKNEKNNQSILKSKNEKIKDKKEEIKEDNNNGTSTKTNDEFFSEKKDDKINESSIEEDSGILSMNEIEDIIIYNDMKDIDKDDNYLFKLDDRDNFIKDYKKIITNLFFDNENHSSENYKQSKIRIKKKLVEINNTINNDYHKNNFKDLNVYTNYNNSSRQSKYNHTLY